MRSGQSSDAEEDRILLAGVARQDQKAFRALVDRHLGAVLSLARRMLRDDAEAEDVAQETLLRLWRAGRHARSRRRMGFGPGSGAWRRISVSTACAARGGRWSWMRCLRKPSRRGQMVALEQQELAKRVDEALKTLPERQRLALTLFHHEGLSQIEVGDIMGISDEAVESLLARARRSLKAQLESEWQSMLTDDNWIVTDWKYEDDREQEYRE